MLAQVVPPNVRRVHLTKALKNNETTCGKKQTNKFNMQ
jgi:hypothetical protein